MRGCGSRDALLALGEVQRAAVVYTRLAQYAAHAGYPLRALTALKILGALEPELSRPGAQRGRALRARLDAARVAACAARCRAATSRAARLDARRRQARAELARRRPSGSPATIAHKDALAARQADADPAAQLARARRPRRVFDACALLARAAGRALMVEQGSRGAIDVHAGARLGARAARSMPDGRVQRARHARRGRGVRRAVVSVRRAAQRRGRWRRPTATCSSSPGPRSRPRATRARTAAKRPRTSRASACSRT